MSAKRPTRRRRAKEGGSRAEPYWRHASAVVDPGARIGAGTKIWHFCHVMSGARIGAGCMLGQNVFVASTAVIGDRCRIQNNVSIYDGVRLDDDVFVGPSVVFTNVRAPRAFVRRRDEVVATRVHRGATIGANATIVCGATVGDYAFVAAGAVVVDDIPAHIVVSGIPAVRHGVICRCGAQITKGRSGPSIECPACEKEGTHMRGSPGPRRERP